MHSSHMAILLRKLHSEFPFCSGNSKQNLINMGLLGIRDVSVLLEILQQMLKDLFNIVPCVFYCYP